MAELTRGKGLFDAAIAGDTAALEQLLMHHFAALERYIEPRISAEARRHLGVEDILQEVLAQAFRDIGRIECRDEGAFFAWLKKVAENRLMDALRRIGRKKRGGDQHRLSSVDFAKASTIATLIDIVGHDSHLPDDSVQRHEAEKAIQIALASVPEDQREALRARFLEGQEVDQIAKQMRRTPAAVQGLITRGKASLAQAMGRSSVWLSTK